MKYNRKLFIPLLLLFIIISSFAVVFSTKLTAYGFDTDMLQIGNLVVFAVTAASFFMSSKAMVSKNNNVFFRLVYGGFIMKLFALAGAALVYIMIEKKGVNKPALFTCMGLYLLYTFIEVSSLMKMLRNKKDA